jgi:hypothetical protein
LVENSYVVVEITAIASVAVEKYGQAVEINAFCGLIVERQSTIVQVPSNPPFVASKTQPISRAAFEIRQASGEARWWRDSCHAEP